MAEKRMISKSISVSEKVNMLPDIFDMLLFTWLVPHTDDFGRLTGSPAKVKALVVPMLDKSIRDVERALSELHSAELIIWYECNGDRYIQIVNFEKHQQGLHKRTKSKFPEAPSNSYEIPEHSRNFPEIPSELNRTEENLTEEKGTEQKGVSPRDLVLKWINQYKLICKGAFQLDEICAYLGMMDVEVIEYSIKQSEGKNVSYAMSIIDRYRREGKTTKESIRQHLQPVPDKKVDKELEQRKIEIARNKWIAEGKNPDEFEYRPAASD